MQRNDLILSYVNGILSHSAQYQKISWQIWLNFWQALIKKDSTADFTDSRGDCEHFKQSEHGCSSYSDSQIRRGPQQIHAKMTLNVCEIRFQ